LSQSQVRIIPLGGLGEIGRNMMAVEYRDDIIVIDAGVMFPEEGMPGIDFVIPDITYLARNRDRVRAVLITHGHEDHTGALPYVLPDLDAPVYASRLTHGLISVKLREHGLLKSSSLNIVEPNIRFKIGKLEVEFFRVCHSIPDAMGIAIHTPLGAIVHTGDFKIDHTPVDGHTTDFAKLAELAAGGVLLLCSDSTYAEMEGYTPSEEVVRGSIESVVAGADARVIVATFASLISRVQMVMDAAAANGRKVAVVGRSMRNNVSMALDMGYLRAPDNLVVPLKEAKRLPHNRLVVLATGAQGEPTSALVRMSRGDHKDVEIETGDTVIISSSPIPGNETLVAKTIDDLFRRGAEVISSRNATVHVHGHASREELKLVLNLVRPTYFVPVHGEHRHLIAHARLAQSLGMDPADTFVLEDGDILEIEDGWAGVVEHMPFEDVYVAGHRLWGRHSSVLEERNRLSTDGVVAVGLTLDAKTGAPLSPPSLESRGFDELKRAQDLLENASQVVHSMLESQSGKVLDFDQIERTVTASVSDLLWKETKRRPTVLTLVERVERS
jgi:ribonuclease J